MAENVLFFTKLLQNGWFFLEIAKKTFIQFIKCWNNIYFCHVVTFN